MSNLPAVILVHGLWMNRYICMPLALGLQREGFKPYLFGYSSLHCNMATNAASLAAFAAGLSADTVHLVGHSLGGLVVLRTLTDHASFRSSRAVLLGSPVRGSLVARSLTHRRGGKLLLGLSMMDWNVAPLDAWSGSTEVGIIAGSFRLGMAMFFSRNLPLPNDGAVAVEETQLPGAKGHIILPVSHTGMLLSSRVMRETALFLRTGSFSRAPE
jgi:pimeloyl-ACP methyl ester carboxylesterase